MGSFRKNNDDHLKKSFPKKERLNSKKIIDKLFSEGKSEYLYPFRILYLEDSSAQITPPKVLFSIPKRNFKRAVDRNKLRRQLREIYRNNKSLFLNIEKFPAFLAIVYTAKEKISFLELEKKLILFLKRL